MLNTSVGSSLFSKKPLLQIAKLYNYQTDSSMHIGKDKLSEKMGRRDIQFYDLYKLDKPKELVQALIDNNLPHKEVLAVKEKVTDEENKEGEDPEEEPIYGDIEAENFNALWKNEKFIEERYGDSINVTVKINLKEGSMTREVKEDLAKAITKSSPKVYKDPKSQCGTYSTSDNLQDSETKRKEENNQSLHMLHLQLENLE